MRPYLNVLCRGGGVSPPRLGKKKKSRKTIFNTTLFKKKRKARWVGGGSDAEPLEPEEAEYSLVVQSGCHASTAGSRAGLRYQVQVGKQPGGPRRRVAAPAGADDPRRRLDQPGRMARGFELGRRPQL